jgi:hypothetical protein
MFNKFAIGTLLAISLLLVGCSTNTSTTITDDRPGVAIIGAQSGDKLYVDKVLMGDAKDYNANPDVLIVEPGRHEVMVISKSGAVLLSESVYVTKGQIRELAIGAR